MNRSGRALEEELRARANRDGGFGPRADAPSEPEPTALAALALDDDRARGWLRSRQGPDGSFSMSIGDVVNDASTALAAIALGAGPERERALDHVESTRARGSSDTTSIPHDTSVLGWAWTEGTFGWVEPTSRAVLALRLLRPSSHAAIADGLGVLADRESVGGGWNYGNRVVLGEDLPPYAQTTAVALLALHGANAGIERRGLATLRRLWREEREGGLSLATSLAALKVFGDVDARAAERALLDVFDRTKFLYDCVALAWGVIATGPAVAHLEVA